MYKLRGRIHAILPTKTFGTSGFRKRTVVLEDDSGRYSQFIPFDFVRDDVTKVDSFNVDDLVEFEFQLNGRKWQKDEDADPAYFMSAEVKKGSIITKAPSQTEGTPF